MDIKIIDLKCRSCGANVDFDEPEDLFFEVNKLNNNILFYHKSDTSKMHITCKHCGTKSAVWASGDETKAFNGMIMNTNINGNNNTVASITIGGSVIGGNIIIGNSKVS